MLRNRERLDEKELNLMPSVVLAYIGDGVYELLSRCHVVKNGPKKIRDIHVGTVKLVHAHHQAVVLQAVWESLTEEEQEVVRRGRNVKSHVPRHADPQEYRYSTGLESLYGYLYLKGEDDRLQEIFQKMMEYREKTENPGEE